MQSLVHKIFLSNNEYILTEYGLFLITAAKFRLLYIPCCQDNRLLTDIKYCFGNNKDHYVLSDSWSFYIGETEFSPNNNQLTMYYKMDEHICVLILDVYTDHTLIDIFETIITDYSERTLFWIIVKNNILNTYGNDVLEEISNTNILDIVNYDNSIYFIYESYAITFGINYFVLIQIKDLTEGNPITYNNIISKRCGNYFNSQRSNSCKEIIRNRESFNNTYKFIFLEDKNTDSQYFPSSKETVFHNLLIPLSNPDLSTIIFDGVCEKISHGYTINLIDCMIDYSLVDFMLERNNEVITSYVNTRFSLLMQLVHQLPMAHSKNCFRQCFIILGDDNSYGPGTTRQIFTNLSDEIGNLISMILKNDYSYINKLNDYFCHVFGLSSIKSCEYIGRILYLCAVHSDTYPNYIHPYFYHKIINNEYNGYVISKYDCGDNDCYFKQYQYYLQNPAAIKEAELDEVTTISDFTAFITKRNLNENQIKILDDIATGFNEQRSYSNIFIPVDFLCRKMSLGNLIKLQFKFFYGCNAIKHHDIFLDIVSKFNKDEYSNLLVNLTGSRNGNHSVKVTFMRFYDQNINYHILTCEKSITFYITNDIDMFASSVYTLSNLITQMRD